MQAMRQDKGDRTRGKWPAHSADVLLGVAAEVDLNLKIFVLVRLANRGTRRLVAYVEIQAIASLRHRIGA